MRTSVGPVSISCSTGVPELVSANSQARYRATVTSGDGYVHAARAGFCRSQTTRCREGLTRLKHDPASSFACPRSRVVEKKRAICSCPVLSFGCSVLNRHGVVSFRCNDPSVISGGTVTPTASLLIQIFPGDSIIEASTCTFVLKAASTINFCRNCPYRLTNASFSKTG